MTELVPPDQIEAIVGRKRDAHRHYARAVSAEQTIYVLHSQTCIDSGIDLRHCGYSVALDKGIWPDSWADHQDKPVLVIIANGQLVPRP